jgi:hypothetical protein
MELSIALPPAKALMSISRTIIIVWQVTAVNSVFGQK